MNVCLLVHWTQKVEFGIFPRPAAGEYLELEHFHSKLSPIFIWLGSDSIGRDWNKVPLYICHTWSPSSSLGPDSLHTKMYTHTHNKSLWTPAASIVKWALQSLPDSWHTQEVSRQFCRHKPWRLLVTVQVPDIFQHSIQWNICCCYVAKTSFLKTRAFAIGSIPTIRRIAWVRVWSKVSR